MSVGFTFRKKLQRWLVLALLALVAAGAGSAWAAAIYYEPTIKNIIAADCGRCHSGVRRNLMDYDQLKAYADSGVLESNVLGGMSRFAGDNADTILTWIDQGAPEQPAAKAVAFPLPAVTLVGGGSYYYEPTIKNIVASKCARCHTGGAADLSNYDNLKAYADGGMLAAMVHGPMGRFAGADAQTIFAWIENGAPEKPQPKKADPARQKAAKQASFWPWSGSITNSTPHQKKRPHVSGLTYNNTIKYVLKGDCLQCHSGKFRNLTTYENVKLYVDNGLLKTLVQVGGPMHRFAGPDSRLIIDWIEDGAPK